MIAGAQTAVDTVRGPGSGVGVAPIGDFDLDEALEQFPLPDGVPDAEMNLDELAGAMNVTVNTTSKWARLPIDRMPLIQEGGQGLAYKVLLSQAFAWRMWMQKRDKDRKAAANAAAAKLQHSLFNLDDETPVLSAKDRREIAEADMHWSKAMRERRRLVPVDEVAELMTDVMVIARESFETFPDRLERELGLTSAQTKIAMRAARDALAELGNRIDEAHLYERELGDVEFDGEFRI